MKNHFLKSSIRSIIIILLLLSGCERLREPFKPKNNNGNTDDSDGYVQTVNVGNYTVLKCVWNIRVVGGQPVYGFLWEQDENNPKDVYLFPDSSPDDKYVGFTLEGVYKFREVLRSSAKDSLVAEWTITVKPREESVFEDPSLEVQVRWALEKPTEPFTRTDFTSLDTLVYNRNASCVITDKITSLNGLEQCTNLTHLYMSLQNITDVSPLAGLTKLEYLDLDQNYNLIDISPLSGLTALKHLNLDTDKIADISCLKNLTELTYLNLLTIYDIQDISVVANFKKLERFLISQSQIMDISALSDLVHLTDIWVIKGGVSDITPLQNLKNLKVLVMDWNNIQDITSLSGLTKLEWINLPTNQIVDISPLENCVNISALRLWDNLITDILPLVNNTGIGSGDMISLTGNPLSTKSINEYIPALQNRGVEVFF